MGKEKGKLVIKTEDMEIQINKVTTETKAIVQRLLDKMEEEEGESIADVPKKGIHEIEEVLTENEDIKKKEEILTEEETKIPTWEKIKEELDQCCSVKIIIERFQIAEEELRSHLSSLYYAGKIMDYIKENGIKKFYAGDVREALGMATGGQWGHAIKLLKDKNLVRAEAMSNYTVWGEIEQQKETPKSTVDRDEVIAKKVGEDKKEESKVSVSDNNNYPLMIPQDEIVKKAEKKYKFIEKKEIVEEKTKDTPPCPYCNSENVIKHGKRETEHGEKQTYSCKECDRRFVEDKYNIKENYELIKKYPEKTQKDISKILEKNHGISITQATISRTISKIEKKPVRPLEDIPRVACPYCSSKNTKKGGFRETSIGKIQNYKCKDCRSNFFEDKYRKILKEKKDRIIKISQPTVPKIIQRAEKEELEDLKDKIENEQKSKYFEKIKEIIQDCDTLEGAELESILWCAKEIQPLNSKEDVVEVLVELIRKGEAFHPEGVSTLYRLSKDRRNPRHPSHPLRV